MKKLLPIFIYLFFFYEVKSEFDDLTGKQLLCKNLSETIGYDFISKEEIVNYKFWDLEGLLSIYNGKYETNLETIILYFPILMNVSMEINRKNLEVSLVGIKGDPTHVCKIFEGNLKAYFQNLNKKAPIVFN